MTSIKELQQSTTIYQADPDASTTDNSSVQDFKAETIAEVDDWRVDIDTSKIETIKTASFIRLFIIRRIICQYINNYNSNKNKNNNKSKKNQNTNTHKNSNSNTNGIKNKSKMMVKKLISGNNNINQSKAINILTRLIEYGLKEYMNNWYSEKKDATRIENIYNEIILTKFAKEYQQLMNYTCSYNHNHNHDVNENGNINRFFYYKRLVLNTNDVMSMIFQHFEFQELATFSLVSSHWLYHTSNINSIYQIDLTTLVEQTLNYNTNDKNKVARMWQRVVNAKSIHMKSSDYREFRKKLILKKLLMFGKVEKIYGDCTDKQLPLLKAIMQKNKDKILCFDLFLTEDSRRKLLVYSPLKLINCHYIGIYHLYFYILWSNKCQTLNLQNISVSHEWCEYVIDHCDCSGIKSLSLSQTWWKFIGYSEKEQKEEIVNRETVLKSLAQKFKSLENLRISFGGFWMLQFWESLQDIIDKNNVKVEIITGSFWNVTNYKKIHQFVKENNVKINKIKVYIDTSNEDKRGIKYVQETIGNPWLEHLVVEYSRPYSLDSFAIIIDDIVEGWKKKDSNSNDNDRTLLQLNNSKYESLEVIQVTNISGSPFPIDLICYFLMSIDSCDDNYNSEKFEKSLLTIAHFKVNCRIEKQLIQSFKTLCQNILNLLMNRAIIIKIKFDNISSKSDDFFEDCNKIYLTYFEKRRVFHNETYNQPKCNQHCTATIIPLAKFQENGYFEVRNVESHLDTFV